AADGGDGRGHRADGRDRAGRRERDEEYVPEEPQGRARIHESARAQLDSVARERAADPAEAAFAVAGMVDRGGHRSRCHEQFRLLLFLWPQCLARSAEVRYWRNDEPST